MCVPNLFVHIYAFNLFLKLARVFKRILLLDFASHSVLSSCLAHSILFKVLNLPFDNMKKCKPGRAQTVALPCPYFKNLTKLLLHNLTPRFILFELNKQFELCNPLISSQIGSFCSLSLSYVAADCGKKSSFHGLYAND